MTDSDPIIVFERVRKVLGGQAVLDEVTFDIRKGETFVIVGASGAGKSVTLKHMVRLMTADAGRVLVDGAALDELDAGALADVRKRFGYLFQGGALLAWLSVADNVALPLLEHQAMPEEAVHERVREVLEMVGLEKDGDKFPDEISGGMRKRAGLARAIVESPEVVLYDEPTSGLDPVTARTIDDLIGHLRDTMGVTSVVVTHDLHSALAIGSRIAMLSNGRISELATPEAFMESDDADVRGFLDAQYITRGGPWERIRR